MKRIIYREALKTDLEPLAVISTEFEMDKLISFEKTTVLNSNKIKKENIKNISKFLSDKTYNYILCETEDSMIAYIFLSYDNNLYAGEGFINEVYVVPKFRNKGIAQKLLKKGINWLKNNNCKTIDITVNKKNKPAIELYKKAGFLKVDDNYFPMQKVI